MRFVTAIRVLLALLVALLMPLEQARCACAAMQQRPAAHAPAAPATLHACCAAKAAAAAGHTAAPHSCATGECSCQKAPAETATPTTLAPAVESSLVVSLAVLHVFTLIAPVSVAAPAPVALDDGGPPLAAAALAHGLRAPPAIA